MKRPVVALYTLVPFPYRLGLGPETILNIPIPIQVRSRSLEHLEHFHSQYQLAQSILKTQVSPSLKMTSLVSCLQWLT